MAIDVLSDRQLNGLKENKINTSKAIAQHNSSVNSNKTAEVSSKTDAVVLTSQSKNLNKALKVAKEADGIDMQKVEKYKKAINEGSFKVNYDSIASRMIDCEAEINSIFR